MVAMCQQSFDDENPVAGIALTLSGDDLGNLLPQSWDQCPIIVGRHGTLEGV